MGHCYFKVLTGYLGILRIADEALMRQLDNIQFFFLILLPSHVKAKSIKCTKKTHAEHNKKNKRVVFCRVGNYQQIWLITASFTGQPKAQLLVMWETKHHT